MLCHKCDVEKINVVSVQLLHQLTEFAIGRKRILNYAERNRYYILDYLPRNVRLKYLYVKQLH